MKVMMETQLLGNYRQIQINKQNKESDTYSFVKGSLCRQIYHILLFDRLYGDMLKACLHICFFENHLRIFYSKYIYPLKLGCQQ